MRILIRTDASRNIGTGHVMRSLTLAGVLREAGASVEFICRSHEGNLLDLIDRRGFKAHALPAGSGTPRGAGAGTATLPPHAHWLEAPWDIDARQTLEAIDSAGGSRVDGLIVDHYGLDARWEKRLRPKAGWVMAVDDLADRPHECDLLLDQNLYEGAARRYEGLVPPGCKMLLGPGYALLREEFLQARQNLRRPPEGVGRVLVFFGGTDPGDNTSKALEALDLAGWQGLAADVVIGEAHPARSAVEAHCAARPGQTVRMNVERMSELMAGADLAIGAGGTTSWERCCLGLPCLAVCVADNQAELLLTLDKTGALRNLGRSEEVSAGILSRALREISDHPERLRRMAEAGMALVDGRGAGRVAEVLGTLAAGGPPEAAETQEPGLVLRKARPADMATYFDWSNEEETRRNSFNSDPVEWSGHFRWFRARLMDPESYLYILENQGQPVGQIRFLCRGASATIGFSVDPAYRGKGFGISLLILGARTLFAENPRIREIIGFVKKTNAPSAKAFQKAGYSLVEEVVHQGAESYQFIIRNTAGGVPAGNT